MKVDVIIPAYNSSDYIRYALDSCLSQSYCDFKITVVDDNSSDNLESIVKDYSGINYIKNEKNMGPAYSRNIGILKTESPLISFLDSDDIWHKDKLLNSVAEFKKDASLGMTCGNYQVLGLDGILKNPFYRRSIVIDHSALMRVNYVASGSTTVRRSVLEDVGLFNEDYWIAEDYDLWVRISEKYSIKYIHKVLYYYRVSNSDSLTNRHDIQSSHIKNLDMIRELSMMRMGKYD